MRKTLWNYLLTSPAICRAMLIVDVAARTVLAGETTTKVLQPLESPDESAVTNSLRDSDSQYYPDY